MFKTTFHLSLGLSLMAVPALAEQKAHEHGHAALNVAIEDTEIEMELIAPGADIVGFEHAPDTDADRAAVDAAVAVFQKGLFEFDANAGCALEAVGVYSALLPGGEPVHSGEHHHDEDHKDEHAHGDGHDDHKDEHDHDHDEKHDDHKDEHAHGHDEKHDDHKDEHGHSDHEDEHAEFRVHFHYDCKDTGALSGMATTYFANFPNAQELDVAALTAKGQVAAELTPSQTRLDF